ncbi:MAG TPA: sigma-70 family RNA polymerase sigma factor [Polyangiaceae bacterium]|nr:sigma-70 family RNA polymerase sigma factor [Polyangiaceae bacterium]
MKPQAASKTRLERMFVEHHEFIWRLLRRLGNGADAAADLVQQAYLVAAERLDDVRPESERAFLFGTALRLSRSWSRREHRCQLEDDMDTRQATDTRVEEVADHRRAIAMMDQILNKLDPELVTVFVLFELEELSTSNIAELLQIPAGTVASRLRRARDAFRTHAQRAERALRQVRQS